MKSPSKPLTYVILVLAIVGIPFVMYYIAGLYDAFSGVSSRVFYPDDRNVPMFYPEDAADVLLPDGSDSYSVSDYPGKFLPGILLIPGDRGLDLDMRTKALQAARHGYAVMIVDIYGGRYARSKPGRLILRSVTSRQNMLERTVDAWETLLSDPRVDPGNCAVVGFDNGASLALDMLKDDARPAATVLLYPPGLSATADEAGALGASGPVLGIFAGDDSRLSAEELSLFSDALKELGVYYQQSIYDNVDRDFVWSDSFAKAGPAFRAWEELLGFLKSNLN